MAKWYAFMNPDIWFEETTSWASSCDYGRAERQTVGDLHRRPSCATKAGHVPSRFVPAILPEPDMTPEANAAALAPDRKTYTTAEVLAYMKGLTA